MATNGGGSAGRWVPWAVRAIVIGLPVAAFAILRPGPFSATVRSPSALVRVSALVVALVVVSRVTRRFVSNTVVRAAVPAALGVGVLALVVLPYFRNEMVVETLPMSAADLGLPAPAVTSTSIVKVESALPVTTTTLAPPAPAPPVRLTGGVLRGIDHRASGTVAVYRLDDGATFVRLEDIDVQNGPDYVLYLVPGADRRSPGSAAIGLGDLKGNQGTQNYAVPAGVDVTAPHTVLIWCRAFSVPVAHATQTPA